MKRCRLASVSPHSSSTIATPIDGFEGVAYHGAMFRNHRRSIFRLTLWGLFSAWIFFGCLELIENSQLIPSIVEDAQESADYDEDALTGLASGLKSDVISWGTLGSTWILKTVVESVITPCPPTVQPRLAHYGPPSLPLYQQLSVYRI